MGSACARRTTTSKGAVVAAGDGANFLEKKIKGEEGNALKKKKGSPQEDPVYFCCPFCYYRA